MKKFLSVLVVMCMTISLLCMPAYAATSGTYGYNLTWTLSDDGTLTISGTGSMIDGDWGPVYTGKWDSELVKSIIIEDGITHIGAWAFPEHNITSITIPDSVTSIGRYAFADCTSLKSVKLPKGLSTIESYTFTNCTALTGIAIPEGVTFVGLHAFYNCSSLASVSLPNSITGIGAAAFFGCTSLRNITIPQGVSNIAEGSFGNCSQLQSIRLPHTITYIPWNAFENCSALSTVYYTGTEDEFNAIRIISGNSSIISAQKIFCAYVATIVDKDGNTLGKARQIIGESPSYVDINALTLPSGYETKGIYKDASFTIPYDINTPITANITLYADIQPTFVLNGVEIRGDESADVNATITKTVNISTDKEARYFVCTVKYPEALELTSLTKKEFTIEEDLRDSVDGYTYLYLTCTYKESGNMPTNILLTPFELKFTVTNKAKPGEILTVEVLDDALFVGDSSYSVADTKNSDIMVNSNVKVSSLTINGASTIDAPTKYTVTVSPSNADNTSVTWSVSDTSIATVSEDGIVTPLKKGTVTLKATANDGSGVTAQKTITVNVYSYITGLSSNIGEWDKEVADRVTEYTLYISDTARIVRLSVTHDGTFKTTDGSKEFTSGVPKVLSIAASKTVLNLTYSKTGYSDRSYTINIVKYKGTKTTVSGKTFTVHPINIPQTTRIILALYNGNKLVEMQSAIYAGNNLTFTAENAYTDARVLAWNDVTLLSPVCAAEDVELQ